MLNFLIDDWLGPSLKVAHQEKISVGCFCLRCSQPARPAAAAGGMMKSTKLSLLVLAGPLRSAKILTQISPLVLADCRVG